MSAVPFEGSIPVLCLGPVCPDPTINNDTYIHIHIIHICNIRLYVYIMHIGHAERTLYIYNWFINDVASLGSFWFIRWPSRLDVDPTPSLRMLTADPLLGRHLGGDSCPPCHN